MDKYIPEIGVTFRDRIELIEKLEESGWEFEGTETYSHSQTGKLIGYNVGVIDEEEDVWLNIRLDPCLDNIRVVGLGWRGRGANKYRREVPDCYAPILGLDIEIKDLIRNLNESGYVTEYSCAGHNGAEEGFVNFTRLDFSEDELRDIRGKFRQHGINRVELRVLADLTKATFPCVGERRSYSLAKGNKRY